MSVALPINWIFSSVLLSLRIAPAFTLAPPFSLTRVPVLFRVMFGLGLAVCMVGAAPTVTALPDLSPGRLVTASASELALGLVFVLALQLLFGALYVAGRVIDVQAGFGLASVIDPATGDEQPLSGMFMVYGTASVFFSLNGHTDLLRILRASLEAIPLGSGGFHPSLTAITRYVSVMFSLGFGIAGGTILCLFVADTAIALLARTVPQMNVFILGLQLKTLLLMVSLPLALGSAGALMARMTVVALQSIPGLF